MRSADRQAPAARGTAWARHLETPLREFLGTETGSAAILLAATLAALVWVNAARSSYDRLWGTTFALRVGPAVLAQDLRQWLNGGLMAFFFFVVGLEARREFDMGELRERRRVACRCSPAWRAWPAGVFIYLAFNAGGPAGARLGHGDVDRHRLRARHAGPGRPALPRPLARLHADVSWSTTSSPSS